MFKLLKAGETVNPGSYYDFVNGEQIILKKKQKLPNTPQGRFIKAPTSIVLATAPLLGLLFVMFLPMIGFVVTFRVMAKKVSEHLVRFMNFGWRPSEAYFTGTSDKEDKEE